MLLIAELAKYGFRMTVALQTMSKGSAEHCWCGLSRISGMRMTALLYVRGVALPAPVRRRSPTSDPLGPAAAALLLSVWSLSVYKASFVMATGTWVSRCYFMNGRHIIKGSAPLACHSSKDSKWMLLLNEFNVVLSIIACFGVL